MTRRIFLSFAPEDRNIAEPLRIALAAVGCEVVTARPARGAEPAREAAVQMSDADLFVGVLTPAYLTSPGCRRERSLALQRESAQSDRFMHLVLGADTRYESESVSKREWLDARPPLDDAKLAAIVARLPLSGQALSAPTNDAASPRFASVFRNRRQELDNLVDKLTTRGGRDLWTVVSPPRLGKSWLLDQLPWELTVRDPRWASHLLDCREHPPELRTNPSVLLSALFHLGIEQQPAGAPLLDEEIGRVVTMITSRQQPQLYILDSAELLSPECASHIRSALTAIYRQVKQSGSRDARLSFVIGTRRHDHWRGLGLDPTIGMRFESLWLTPFGVDIVEEALSERAHHLSDADRWKCAQQLYRLSQGLPALLVPSLRWAEERSFPAGPLDEEGPALDEIAGDYIEDDLLAAKCLLPAGAPNLDQALDLLRRALRVMSVYRFFTQSHVRYHVDRDADLRHAVEQAGWSRPELWEALSRTSLCDQEVTELWQVIAPPIRRLLYGHYYRSRSDRIESHLRARRFYEEWTAIRAAGREQPVVLVECLWHEASRMVIEQPSRVEHQLPTITTSLAYKFADSPVYEPEEFSEFVVARLHDDEEFRLLLQPYRGLFEDIVKSVKRALGEHR